MFVLFNVLCIYFTYRLILVSFLVIYILMMRFVLHRFIIDGFGAAADVVMYLPFLRNIMAWLSAGSASYKALKEGLVKVIFHISY